MASTPDTDNYSIPTGYALFTPSGGVQYDLGNIVDFKISNNVQKKEHFRSRGGRRTKDKTIITQVGATISFTLDEIVAKNIAIFALGTITTDTDGNSEITGLTNTEFNGVIKIIGDNDIGTQVDWEGKVSFTPSGDFNFIQNNDDFNSIAVTADVEEDETLGFGKWSVREIA